MHAVYKTNSTWTFTQMVSDLCKLITGTTDIGTLSASCDQTQTSIVANTVPADWTLYDTAPTNPSGTTGMQIMSRIGSQDSLTKYISLSAYSTTNLAINSYTSWNDSTHTGVDSTITGEQGYSIGYSTSLAAVFYLWVTPSYIVILGNQSASWKNAQLAVEFNRTENITYSDYWATGNNKSICGVCPIANNSSSFLTFLPRIKYAGQTGDLTSAQIMNLKAVPSQAIYAQRNIDNTNNGILLSPWVGYSTSQPAYFGTINNLLCAMGSSRDRKSVV